MDQARAGVAQTGEEKRKMGEGGRTKRSSSKRMRVRVMCALPRESCFSGPVSLPRKKPLSVLQTHMSRSHLIKLVLENCRNTVQYRVASHSLAAFITKLQVMLKADMHTTFRYVPTAIHVA